MSDEVRSPHPTTWVDKDTGIIWTRDRDTDEWVNSSIADGKPRLLAVDSVTAEDLKDGSVTEPKLATDAVSTRTIIDSNVTVDKLADDVLALIAAASSSTRWEVLMASGITDPPDPVVGSDGTDWLYGEAPLT